MAFAIYGIVILGIFLGLVGEFILERQDENMQKRRENVRVKLMEQFSKDDSGEPPAKRSLWSTLWSIVVAEIPILLVLLVIAVPVVYTEGWDPVMG